MGTWRFALNEESTRLDDRDRRYRGFFAIHARDDFVRRRTATGISSGIDRSIIDNRKDHRVGYRNDRRTDHWCLFRREYEAEMVQSNGSHAVGDPSFDRHPWTALGLGGTTGGGGHVRKGRLPIRDVRTHE